MKIYRKKNRNGKQIAYVNVNVKKTGILNPTAYEPPSTEGVGRNTVEDQMVGLMDELALFRDLEPELRTALKTRDAKSMLRGASAWAIAQMVSLAKNSTSEAVRQAALKDILDRAGYKPVDKQAVLNMNDLTEGEIDAKLSSLLKEANLGSEGSDTSLKSRIERSIAGATGAKAKAKTEE